MIILEFSQDRLKLLEVAKKGQKFVLANISKRPISGLSDGAIKNAVLDLLNELGVKKGSLTVSIPRHLFTVRNLRLPSLDDLELKDMVALQAGKQLPYPAEELIWDFKVIEKRPDGYSDVFLALGHRNVIDRFIKILEDANLKVEGIILSSEALSSWYLGVIGSKEEELGSQIKAVVDIDTSHIEAIVLKGTSLEFSRSFPFKDNLEEMAEEIRKTFYSYQKDSLKEVASIVLTGIEERALRLKPLLEALHRIGQIDYIHPLKIVSMDYRESLSDYFDLCRDISFCCILGIGYNLQSIKMDFLPPDLKEERSRQKKRRLFIKTTSLLIAISIALFAISIKGIMDKRTQLKSINLKIKEAEPRVKRLKEISQNIEIIKQHLDMKGSSIDVLREIFKIVPSEVSISVLDFELEKSLTLRGVSADLSSVFRFASELEKSVYFENCQIKYAQKRVVKEKEFVDFEISCKLTRIAG